MQVSILVGDRKEGIRRIAGILNEVSNPNQPLSVFKGVTANHSNNHENEL